MYQRTYAKINLDAIEYNINHVLKTLNGRAKLLAVIKADAYGHGAVEIGRLLEDKCDFFGVACVEEAVELKKSGITTPILILGSVSPQQFDVVVRNDFRIPIFSFEDAKALSQEAVKQNKDISFHFCIDTGMSRIGFQTTEESADICHEICSLPNIFAEGIFSHFATADESNLTKSVKQQKLFRDFCGMLESRGVVIPIKHLNNSAGIMVFEECFDMVRSGIITYGLYPSDEVDKSLIDIKPALEWITHISHIKTLPAGREISYGGTYITDKETVVATIPVGYADGYPRCLSNMGRVLVGGRYADIIGRVCMDQFMVDITDIPGVSLEDEVVLVGKQGDNFISIEEVGNMAHSFNYELACSISRRVPRVYTKNNEIVKTVNYLEK